MPGVIKGISSNTNQYGRRDTAIAISANGMRENQGQVLYDGVSTAWNINNATFFKASIEAIRNSSPRGNVLCRDGTMRRRRSDLTRPEPIS